MEDSVRHRPILGNDAPLVAVYAIAKLKDGESIPLVLSKAEVDRYRKRSKASTSGPWVTDYEAMAMKTAVRRLATWLPSSVELAAAQAIDGRPRQYEVESTLEDFAAEAVADDRVEIVEAEEVVE